MDLYSLDFSDQFHYPPIIKKLIASFCDSCRANLGNTIESIVLIGSAARGELTWAMDSTEQPLFYSDLEFYVYVRQGPSKTQRKKLANEINALQAPLTARCPFFHFDYSIASLSHGIGSPRKFINFESKATGKTVFGSSILGRLPDLDSSTLNFKELNEILLHRLWAMLLYLPASLLREAGNHNDFSYILCRNVLDITTWLLPYEHTSLIAGFKGRLDFINADWDNLGFKVFFSPEDREFLNACYNGKMNLSFVSATTELYERAVHLFITATKYMLHKNGIHAAADSFQNVPLSARQLFQGCSPRRMAGEIVLLSRNGKWRNPFKAVRWMLLAKRALAVNFCFNMHRANIAFLSNKGGEQQLLDQAFECLTALYPDMPIPPTSEEYTERWLYLRRRFVDYRIVYERGYQAQKKYLYGVLGVQ